VQRSGARVPMVIFARKRLQSHRALRNFTEPTGRKWVKKGSWRLSDL